MFPPQEGQTTMAIVKSSTIMSKSTQSTTTNSKEDQMAASTAVMPRYAVFSLSGKAKKGDEWTSYFLSVSPEAPLSDKEKAALLDAFDIAVGGKPRKNFEPSYFRGKNAAMQKTGVFGGELYWLAGEETMDLKVAKNNVLEILGAPDGKKAGKAGKPAAQQPQEAPEKGKAAKGSKKDKNTQVEAAKERNAKRNAYTVVLG